MRRKTAEDTFYDVFSSWPLAEQKIVLKVLERLVIEREREAKRTEKKESEAKD